MIRNTCQARTNDVTNSNFFFNLKYLTQKEIMKYTINILTISRLLEVNISITERTSGNHITTDAYREYRPSWWKLLEKHRLGDITMQVTHIKWGHRVIWSSRIHCNKFKMLWFLVSLVPSIWLALFRPRCSL